MNSLFPGTVSYFSGKIKIHSGKDAGINKTINSSFTDHNGIPVSGTDMMRGLSLFIRGVMRSSKCLISSSEKEMPVRDSERSVRYLEWASLAMYRCFPDYRYSVCHSRYKYKAAWSVSGRCQG